MDCLDNCFSILQFEPSLFCLMTGRLISKSFYEASLLFEHRLSFKSRKEFLDFIKLMDRKFIRKVVEIKAKNCDLVDDDMEIIGSLFENLKILDVHHNDSLTETGLSLLEGSSQIANTLQYLNVSKCKALVGISTVPRGFKNLKTLICDEIDKSSSNSNSALVLNHPHQLLEHLSVNGYSESLKLQNFPFLKQLEIRGGKDSSWKYLGMLSSLECLSMTNCGKIGGSVDFNVFKQLKKLTIASTSLTIENVESIAKNLDCIESLSLVRVSSQGDEIIQVLCDMNIVERLNTLILCDNRITDSGVEHLISKSKFEKLESLGLSSTAISETAVSMIANCSKLVNLKRLTLQRFMDYSCLEQLMNGCLLNLIYLDIGQYEGTANMLDDFLQSPFARKLLECKMFDSGELSSSPFQRNVQILKSNTVSVESLLEFMLNRSLLENPLNFYNDTLSNSNTTSITNERDGRREGFRLQLLSLDNILPHHLNFTPFRQFLLGVQAELCYGNRIIERCSESFTFDFSTSIQCNHHCFNFSKRFVDLPYESTVRLNLYILDLSSMRRKIVAHTILPLFSSNSSSNSSGGNSNSHIYGIVQQNMYNIIESNSQQLLWKRYYTEGIDTTPSYGKDIRVVVQFDKYRDDSILLPNSTSTNEVSCTQNVPSATAIVEELLTKQFLNDEEKSIIWNNRDSIPKTQLGLKKLMDSFPYWCNNSRQYMRDYVRQVSKDFKTTYQYLELLGESFVDSEIRHLAHIVFSEMPDTKFLLCMEIIVDLLKFEIHIDNPLSQIILRRSLENVDIGRRLFWCIQGNLLQNSVRDKLIWLASYFLNNISSDRLLEFYNQCLYIYQLVEIDANLKEGPRLDVTQHTEAVIKRVSEIDLPTPFILPYPPYNTVQRIDAQKTELSNSKRRHLIITFESNGKMDQFVLLSENNKTDCYTTCVLRMLGDILSQNHDESINYVQTSVIPLDHELYLCEKNSTAKSLAQIQYGNPNRKIVFDFSPWIGTGISKFPNFGENLLRSYAFCAVIEKVLNFSERHNDNIFINEEGFMYLYEKNCMEEQRRRFLRGFKRRDGFFGGLGLVKQLKSKTFKNHAVNNFYQLSQNSRLIYTLINGLYEFGWNSEYLMIPYQEYLCHVHRLLEEQSTTTIEQCNILVDHYIEEGEAINRDLLVHITSKNW